MFNPLTPYFSIINFALEPILKAAFAIIAVGIVMVAFGYDPIGLAIGWVDATIRSFIPGI